jgi:hypothetical protein
VKQIRRWCSAFPTLKCCRRGALPGVVSHEKYRVVRDLLPRYARIATRNRLPAKPAEGNDCPDQEGLDRLQKAADRIAWPLRK